MNLSHTPLPLGHTQGIVGATLVAVVLLTLPLLGLDAHPALVAAVYVSGIAAVVGHLRRPDGLYTGVITAAAAPIAWSTLVILASGGTSSPYLFLLGVAVLLNATFRGRHEYLLAAGLAAAAILGIRFGTGGDPAFAPQLLVASSLLVLLAAYVANAMVQGLRVARAEIDLLRAAVDELVEPVTIYDATTGRYLYVNEAAAAISGVRPQDFIGRSVEGLVEDDVIDAEAVAASEDQGLSVEKVLAAEGVIRTSLQHVTPAGEPHELDVMVQRQRVLGRDVVVSVAHDVTALRSAVRAEQAAYQNLQRLDELKNTFLSAASHELRTPLTVVKALAETVARNHDRLGPEEVVELLGKVNDHADRLADVLDDLFDIDRLTHDRIQAKRELIDPVVPVQRAAARRRPGAVSVRSRVDQVRVDPTMFARIIDNLVSNAGKYAPGPLDICLEPLEDAGLHLTVSDRGPGIPDEAKLSVFEPFIRLDPGHPSPGTGVGLALVANFAGLHGGRVWIEDRVGGGSRVHVLLPGAAREEQADLLVAVGDRRRAPRPGEPTEVPATIIDLDARPA